MNLKYGVVSAWDPLSCKIRVTLPGDNNLETFWLQVPQNQTFNTQQRNPIEIGTEVAIGLNDDGVDGVLLGAIYSETSPPPIDDESTHIIKHSDGATIKYDPVTHIYDIALPAGGTLNINSPDGVTITANTSVTIKADTIIEGNLTITKNIQVQGKGSSGNSTISGNFDVKGNVNVNETIKANGVIESLEAIKAPNIE